MWIKGIICGGATSKCFPSYHTQWEMKAKHKEENMSQKWKGRSCYFTCRWILRLRPLIAILTLMTLNRASSAGQVYPLGSLYILEMNAPSLWWKEGKHWSSRHPSIPCLLLIWVAKRTERFSQHPGSSQAWSTEPDRAACSSPGCNLAPWSVPTEHKITVLILFS